MEFEERLLSVKDVATLLCCGVSTVWQKQAAEEIPRSVRMGSSTRWKMSDLQKFIAELQPAGELR